MEDKSKNRGIQHLKNKAKYKNKSKVIPKAPVAPVRFESPPLGSNWDRYEEDIILPNNYLRSSGSDFSILADAPIAKGKHFRFKSDISDGHDIENPPVDTSGLFNLDLNLLGLSIASIPFNERCTIPEAYFTVAQLNCMKRASNDCATTYQHSLRNKNLQSHSNIEKLSHKDTVGDRIQVPPNTVFTESIADKHKIARGDKLVSVKSNKINQSYSDIDRLSELEEELDRITLVKSSAKDSYGKAEGKAYGTSSYDKSFSFQPSQSNSCDASHDKLTGPSEAAKPSFLETESLQQWLDDVLED